MNAACDCILSYCNCKWKSKCVHIRSSRNSDTNTFNTVYVAILSEKTTNPKTSQNEVAKLQTFPQAFFFFFLHIFYQTIQLLHVFLAFYKNTPSSLLCSSAKNNLKSHAIRIWSSHCFFSPMYAHECEYIGGIRPTNALPRLQDSSLPPSAGNGSEKNG